MRPLSPSRTARRILVAFAAVVLLAVAAPTAAGASDASDYVARINALRASVGVQPLQVDGELTAAAQRWAEHMAATDTLSHASDLSAGISSYWLKLGENVGVGPDNATIWTAFVNSARHYANLVDPAFNRVGVGVASAGPGHQYTCHRFMQVAAGGRRGARRAAHGPRRPRDPPPAARAAPARAARAAPARVAPVAPAPRPRLRRSPRCLRNPALPRRPTRPGWQRCWPRCATWPADPPRQPRATDTLDPWAPPSRPAT